MILILKDSDLGPYVEYDDQADVMLATFRGKDEPLATLWRTCEYEPDLDIGYFVTQEQVCIDRYCDEREEQEVPHYTWLRLRNAKAHGNWGPEKAFWLAVGMGLGFGLVNTLRHGQLALLGEHWWEIRVKS